MAGAALVSSPDLPDVADILDSGWSGMRSLAFIMVTIGCAACGWAAVHLMDVMAQTTPARAFTSPDPVAQSPAATPQATRPFLAIYGTAPVAPVATNQAEPPPRNIPYTLKGVVAVGENRWAILAWQGEDLIVREGDALDDGFAVSRVHAEGVELVIEDETIALAFDAASPVRVAQIPQPSTAATAVSDAPKGNLTVGNPVGVLFQDMTGDEILAALEKAEERRRARGWTSDSN